MNKFDVEGFNFDLFVNDSEFSTLCENENKNIEYFMIIIKLLIIIITIFLFYYFLFDLFIIYYFFILE